MRQREALKRPARRGTIALIILCALISLFYLQSRASSTVVEPQQRRRQQPQNRRRRPPQPQATSRGGRNYSRFKHEDHRLPVAKLECSDCHAIPSPAAPDTIVAATKPSVDGYPYHDSCVRCHRQQFFRGATPPICTVCHTRATPRVTARDMHKFPKQSDQAIAREFPGYFPHGLHQSVIARREKPPSSLEGGWTFVRASYKKFQDTPGKVLDNCATCHLTDGREPAAIAVGGTEATFKPEKKGTFMTVATGHASCFNCHWQSQKPLKDDCAGCHLARGEYTKKKRAASPDASLPGVLSPNAAQWFKGWPSAWPKRLSIKFSHATPSEHDRGCTTCHINITQMETLNIPKADVPIATCMPCHYSDKSVARKAGEKVTIYSEMTAEASDKDNKTNTCMGCHTSLIGRERPPCSHYLVLGQPCPK